MTSAGPSNALSPLIEAIDAVLPQTQCTRCGYPACRPYAEAVARHEIPINRCEPGDIAVIEALATLTQTPLIERFHAPQKALVAFIREDDCIGCARCLPACPVDAIIGSRKLLHRVISDQCTGCQLCVDPCPVDCIDLIERPKDLPLPTRAENLSRYERHLARKRARAEHHQRTLNRASQRALLIERARAARAARRESRT